MAQPFQPGDAVLYFGARYRILEVITVPEELDGAVLYLYSVVCELFAPSFDVIPTDELLRSWEREEWKATILPLMPLRQGSTSEDRARQSAAQIFEKYRPEFEAMIQGEQKI
jgi:hypothetical protein